MQPYALKINLSYLLWAFVLGACSAKGAVSMPNDDGAADDRDASGDADIADADTADANISDADTADDAGDQGRDASGGQGDPSFFVSPGALFFSTQEGGASPAAQTLELSTMDAVEVRIDVSVDASSTTWLTVSSSSLVLPPGGTTSLEVSVATESLAPGTYAGAVELTAGATTRSVPVSVSIISSGADLYPYYPRLDLSRIPFHTATGPWGPRDPIAAPALPDIRTTVDVTSDSELTAALADGAKIVLSSGAFGPLVIEGYSDIELQINDGVTTGPISLGDGARFHIHGESPGATGSGQIRGAIRAGTYAAISDLIVDGLSQVDGAIYNEAFAVARVAYLRMRVKNMDIAYNNFTDLVVAGCNAYQTVDGWQTRLQGAWRRVVYFENQMSNQANAVVRFVPAMASVGPPGNVWMGDSTLINRNEGFLFRVAPSTLGQENAVTGAWYTGCEFWSATAGAEISPDTGSCDYFRGTSSTVYVVGGSYAPSAPELGEDWVIDVDVLDATAHPPPTTWTERNTAGDPTAL